MPFFRLVFEALISLIYGYTGDSFDGHRGDDPGPSTVVSTMLSLAISIDVARESAKAIPETCETSAEG
jgi:hypothetical protein